jgi:hypothetical protein
LRRCRLRSSKHKKDHRDNEGDAFHKFQPFKGSPKNGFLRLLARSSAVFSFAGQFSRANSTYVPSCLNKTPSEIWYFRTGLAVRGTCMNG